MASPSAHLGQALRSLSVARSNSPATICDGRVKTGARLVQRISALASGLRKIGLKCGDRVAIAALNSDCYLEWLLAVPCAGGIVAPLNYRWSVHEACEAMHQIDPAFLVVDQHCSNWASEIKLTLPNMSVVTLGCSIVEALDTESIIQLGDHKFRLFWAPNGIALICFTSGTTGKPKGAAISHNALIIQSLAKIAVVDYSCNDVYLHTSPLCHIGGISSAHAMIMAGGCHVFQPKFQTLEVVEAIRQYKVTAMITVPAMLKDLTSFISLRGEDRLKSSLASIRTILNGAGSLSLEVLKRTVECFPAARILSAYGMTEACSSLSFLVCHDPRWETNQGYDSRRISETALNETNGVDTTCHLGGICIGKSAPHVEMTVGHKSCLESEGHHVYEGNVLVRGPQMMENYWGSAENAFVEDGWFDTGDVGWMDDLGRLWLLGRRKDVIKSGGENVYCCEVESILLRHPAISAAAVVGVHDSRLDEKVGALLLLKEGWKWEEDLGTGIHFEYAKAFSEERVLSPSLLSSYCRQQGLSRYKVPKIWCRKTEPFPVTSTGKVRKDLLREELTAYCINQSVVQASGFRYSKL